MLLIQKALEDKQLNAMLNYFLDHKLFIQGWDKKYQCNDSQ